MQDPPIELSRLTPADIDRLEELNALFAEAFDDPETYTAQPPSRAYRRALLRMQHVIVLVAAVEGRLAGGLLAYELDKIESARREMYIYDLAVAAAYRRRGVATALIQRLRELARSRGAWVIFVQADYGDGPAIGLYEKLGVREQVLHFDIPPDPG